MNYRDFKTAIVVEADGARDYEQIVFRTPDSTTYNNIKVDFTTLANSKHKVILVDLFNIKPKFKVGDIVCNNNGLYANVKCTITEVNEELQYYGYKEINGRTYFKDQDKLMCINCDEVQHPVEDSIKLDGFNARFAKNNVLTYNLEYYPLIKNMINVISKASNEGKICHTFIIPYVTKNDAFGVYYDEDEICGVIRWHFKELGFNVKDKNDEVNNRTEFFISW